MPLGGLVPEQLLKIVAAATTGHALGGPDPGTRTAVAVCAAARNPGLALLVALLNAAPTGVVATVFAYLVISALTLIPCRAAHAPRRRCCHAMMLTPPST
jgi:hypothetical protein